MWRELPERVKLKTVNIYSVEKWLRLIILNFEKLALSTVSVKKIVENS